MDRVVRMDLLAVMGNEGEWLGGFAKLTRHGCG
jgi:hypothetical protein